MVKMNFKKQISYLFTILLFSLFLLGCGFGTDPTVTEETPIYTQSLSIDTASQITTSSSVKKQWLSFVAEDNETYDILVQEEESTKTIISMGLYSDIDGNKLTDLSNFDSNNISETSFEMTSGSTYYINLNTLGGSTYYVLVGTLELEDDLISTFESTSDSGEQDNQNNDNESFSIIELNQPLTINLPEQGGWTFRFNNTGELALFDLTITTLVTSGSLDPAFLICTEVTEEHYCTSSSFLTTEEDGNIYRSTYNFPNGTTYFTVSNYVGSYEVLITKSE